MADGPTGAVLDRDRLDRIEAPEETPEQAAARRQELAKRYASFLAPAPEAPGEPVVAEIEIDLDVPQRLAAILAEKYPENSAEIIAAMATEYAASLALPADDREGIQVAQAQSAEEWLAAAGHECGCAEHPDDEPCEACALSAMGTTIVVVGDGAEAAPAAAGADDPGNEGAAAVGEPAVPAEPVEIDPANPGRFRAVLVTEGERTADDRIIDAGATEWRPVPLTLMCMVETAPGHMGARVAAVLENIYRDGNKIIGEGRFDTGDDGINAARLVANGVLTGISVDPGDVTVETEIEEFDEDGWPTKWLDHYTSMTLLGATICPFQAIGSAHIEYVAPVTASLGDDVDMDAQAAAIQARLERPFVSEAAAVSWLPADADAAPLTEGEAEAFAVIAEAEGASLTAGIGIQFPSHAFANPGLTGPTPLHVNDDGTFAGHLAIWGECHVGFAGTCMLAPRSRTGYAYFMGGYVETEQGEQPIGPITIGTVHADEALGYAGALRHYEDTGLVVGYCASGEDKHGIWVAGVLKPGTSAETVTEFTASTMSGDWREIRGRLELAAILGVNSPGFPVARIQNGRAKSLVAAIGPVRPRESLAHAELRNTRERIHMQAERLDHLEATVERMSRQMQPVIVEHLAARLSS